MFNLPKTPAIANNNYQTHIDGIRAIAVLGVILFHANKNWLPGGFIGVDIFFVISGYLISGLIYKKSLDGNFSLSEFYVKRIRRIFPVLVTMIIVTFPVAWVLLLPDEMRNYSRSIFSSILMYSNQQFLNEAGYFDTQSHLKPLLHTWSLSIEAQFYFIFPLIFLFVFKLTKQPIYFIGIFGFFAFISFFAGDIATQINNEKSFFYFYARAWEMLAGCLVMLFANKVSISHQLIKEVGSIIGIIFILYAFLFFDPLMLHPGKATLIPILGSILLILFATRKTIVGQLLTSTVMVGIGLISYSLYLWHQPIIVFAKLQSNNLTAINWVMIFGLITILSLFSWRYIETPFRFKKFMNTHVFLGFLSSVVLILLVTSLWGYQSNGFIQQRFSKDKIALLNDLDNDRYRTFLFKHLYENEVIKSKFKNNNKPRMLIVGDSYAADFMNMVVYNKYFNQYQIRTLYIPARCQFYMGDEEYLNFIDERDKKLCEQAQIKLRLLKQNLDKVDQVIFAFYWKDWAAKHIDKSITALDYDKSQEKFIFLGSKQFAINKRNILSKDSNKLAGFTSKRIDRTVRVNKLLAKELNNHIFIDQDAIFCGEKNQCPLFTIDNHPVSIDGQHLTPEGAIFLGGKLFNHPALSKLNSL